MACNEFEILILEFLEHQLPEGERQRVEAHLRGCADCRAFAQELSRLDAALVHSIQPLQPSANFDSRLRKRIQAAPLPLSEAEKAERRRRLQAEYEAGLARLPLRSLSAVNLLNVLGYAAGVAMAGWIAWWYAPRWITLLNACRWSLQDPSTVLLLGISGAITVLGVAAAFRWPSRRLWTAG